MMKYFNYQVIKKFLTFFQTIITFSWLFIDPRVDVYPLMKSGVFNTINTIIYLIIVTYAGKRFMKNRPAYNIRKFIFCYNVLMVLFSTYLFYEVFSIRCNQYFVNNKLVFLGVVFTCWLGDWLLAYLSRMWLFKFSSSFEDVKCLLLLLVVKTHRILGYGDSVSS